VTTGAAPRSRPVLVTTAVVLWLVALVVQLVATLAQTIRNVQTDGAWAIGPMVIGLAIWGWFLFGALRMGRGSGRARFWMAVLGALGFLGACVPPYGTTTVTGVAGGVAAVLPYLPAARGYFPPRPPRTPKAPAPRVVGWDPETGEPIRATD